MSPDAGPEPAEVPTGGDVLATITQRALALAIDTVLVVLPVAGLGVALGVNPVDEAESTSALLALTAIWLGIAVAYETVGVAVFARTVGKHALGLKVVRSADGGRVGWTYASVRALVPAAAGLVPWIGFALQLAVYLRAAFHPWRQGWHDIAAGTLVVRSR